MTSTIPTQTNFPKSNQIPDHAILDINGKQIYLGNQFIFSINATLGSTSESVYYLLMNPSTSGKSIFHNTRKLSCLSSNNVIFRFYFNPTITGTTTSGTPINIRPANSNTSIAGVYNSSNFSVSANGSYLASLVSSNYTPDVSSVLFVLDPGQSMLITVQSNEPSGIPVSAELLWYEL